ncbi:MAG: rubrerythrin [Alphaproteobacteria bacterium]|nr:rubrerythrin [Alphaproteobacteria bacterium]
MTPARRKKSARLYRVRVPAELLRIAHAMENEARVRYGELADQLDAHNNTDVADLFRRMAEIEALHVAKVLALAGGKITTPADAPPFPDDEGPETAATAAAHYLMTPHHALSIMLKNEQRAFRFYSRVARTTKAKDVRNLAQQLAQEEKEHIQLAQAWLAKYPPPPNGWDEDPDPPSGAG